MRYHTVGDTVICYVEDSTICYVLMFYGETIECFLEDFDFYAKVI